MKYYNVGLASHINEVLNIFLNKILKRLVFSITHVELHSSELQL